MQNKNAIIALLNEKFYVPVLRSPDNTVQPVVGEPISLADFKVCIIYFAYLFTVSIATMFNNYVCIFDK